MLSYHSARRWGATVLFCAELLLFLSVALACRLIPGTAVSRTGGAGPWHPGLTPFTPLAESGSIDTRQIVGEPADCELFFVALPALRFHSLQQRQIIQDPA